MLVYNKLNKISIFLSSKFNVKVQISILLFFNVGKMPPCKYWPNFRWPYVHWPNVHWPCVRWPCVCWPYVWIPVVVTGKYSDKEDV